MNTNAQILQNVRCVGKLFERMGKKICLSYGLTRLEFDIISFLASNPGLDTARDIVELRMLPKANVSLAVESLMGKGYLVRRQDVQDRRRIHLVLTRQSEAMLPEITQARRAFVEALFEGFTEAERAQYEQMSSRISANALRRLEKGETSNAGQ